MDEAIYILRNFLSEVQKDLKAMRNHSIADVLSQHEFVLQEAIDRLVSAKEAQGKRVFVELN